MTSNWHVGNSVCDSQNFILRLSEGSSIEDSSPQRFVANKKREEDIIVISDSSCNSSPMHIDKQKWKSCSTSNAGNGEYQQSWILEISSESEKEKESDSSGKLARSDNKFSKKRFMSRTVVQVNKNPTEASLISNNNSSTAERLFDSLLTSSALTNDKTAISSYTNYDRDQVNKRHFNDRSPILITEQERNSKLKPSCAIYNNSPNVLSKYPTCNTPKQDSAGKARLTKEDTYKILKNIKYMQTVYDSPRNKKENVIINESTDIDEDILHPALSPNYIRKIQHLSDSDPDVINSLKKDILQAHLQAELSESSKSHDISGVMNSFRPLSERRKKQIKEWLQVNFPDSQSDSSFNTVPPSTRNSNSGNSSLERLELTHETPNNRGRIDKTQTDEKQRTIVNSDRVVHSFLTRQTTLDQHFRQSKNNSEFFIPDNKLKLLPKVQTDKKASPVVNTPETMDTMDCVDILDKLYGTSWRDKANALLPTTEPRKTSIQTVNRIVQTER